MWVEMHKRALYSHVSCVFFVCTPKHRQKQQHLEVAVHHSIGVKVPHPRRNVQSTFDGVKRSPQSTIPAAVSSSSSAMTVVMVLVERGGGRRGGEGPGTVAVTAAANH